LEVNLKINNRPPIGPSWLNVYFQHLVVNVADFYNTGMSVITFYKTVKERNVTNVCSTTLNYCSWWQSIFKWSDMMNSSAVTMSLLQNIGQYCKNEIEVGEIANSPIIKGKCNEWLFSHHHPGVRLENPDVDPKSR
jgi:hypothetical protein